MLLEVRLGELVDVGHGDLQESGGTGGAAGYVDLEALGGSLIDDRAVNLDLDPQRGGDDARPAVGPVDRMHVNADLVEVARVGTVATRSAGLCTLLAPLHSR